MVLLEDLGLEVQILVNGKLAEEFEDRKSDDLGDDVGSQTSMAHRYIESVAGATFSISAGVISKSCPAKDRLDADGENTFKFLLSIDGKAVGSTWVDSDRLTGIVNGVKDLLSNTIQRFQFATISTIENATEDLEAEHTEQSKDIGIIRIHAHRTIRKVRKQTASEWTKHNSHNNGPAHLHQRDALASGDEITLAEKALKGRALAHGATLGPATKMRFLVAGPSDTITDWKWVDPRRTPYAVFTFTYRSKDALKQELVIPRSPSPSFELPHVDSHPPEEIHRLTPERLLDVHDHKPAVNVKREGEDDPPSRRPRKMGRFQGKREVIDLTND